LGGRIIESELYIRLGENEARHEQQYRNQLHHFEF